MKVIFLIQEHTTETLWRCLKNAAIVDYGTNQNHLSLLAPCM